MLISGQDLRTAANDRAFFSIRATLDEQRFMPPVVKWYVSDRSTMICGSYYRASLK